MPQIRVVWAKFNRVVPGFGYPIFGHIGIQLGTDPNMIIYHFQPDSIVYANGNFGVVEKSKIYTVKGDIDTLKSRIESFKREQGTWNLVFNNCFHFVSYVTGISYTELFNTFLAINTERK